MKKLLLLIALLTPVFCLAQSPANYKLEKIRTFSGYFRGAFSPTGERLALIYPEILSVFSTRTGKRICSFKAPGPENAQPRFTSVVFVPGTNLIAANFNDFQPEASSVTLRIIFLDSATCNETSRLVSEPSQDVGVYVTTSSDGSLIAASADVGRIWARETGKEVYRDVPPEKYKLKESVMSPDGKYLVSYVQSTIPPYQDYKVFLTNVQTKDRREISSILTWGIQFSNDSHTLTLIGYRKQIGPGVTLSQFALPSGEKTREFLSNDIHMFPDLSGNGALVASGSDDEIEGGVSVVRISDGQLLAKGIHYKRTRMDDFLDRGHLITQMELVKFSPDGTMLLTGGEDGSVKLWKLNVHK